MAKAWHTLNQLLEDPQTELYHLCRQANELLFPHRGGSLEEPQTFQLFSLAQTTPKLGLEPPRQHTARFLELLASSLQPDQLSRENDDPFDHHQGVTCSTIHSAKGMQWKIVWVVDPTDDNLPNLRWNSDDAEELEEERVFYVAATRATDQIHFCYADPEEDGGTEPSRFLQALGDLLENGKSGLSPNRPGKNRA